MWVVEQQHFQGSTNLIPFSSLAEAVSTAVSIDKAPNMSANIFWVTEEGQECPMFL